MVLAKGSLRCVLDLVSSNDFVPKMNSIIESTRALIDRDDSWMPLSYQNDKEAELKDFLAVHFNSRLGEAVKNWWLAVPSMKSRTPNWDIISTCTVDGAKGVLLVEAKAHYGELKGEEKGKPLRKDASTNSVKNHKRIGEAINEANKSINQQVRGVAISRDRCYQLSNRVAHAWWLANQGIPVVLLYLGFLNVGDMKDNYCVFHTAEDWETCFLEHASIVGVNKIVNKCIYTGKSSFTTIFDSLLDK